MVSTLANNPTLPSAGFSRAPFHAPGYSSPPPRFRPGQCPRPAARAVGDLDTAGLAAGVPTGNRDHSRVGHPSVNLDGTSSARRGPPRNHRLRSRRVCPPSLSVSCCPQTTLGRSAPPRDSTLHFQPQFDAGQGLRRIVDHFVEMPVRRGDSLEVGQRSDSGSSNSLRRLGL